MNKPKYTDTLKSIIHFLSFVFKHQPLTLRIFLISDIIFSISAIVSLGLGLIKVDYFLAYLFVSALIKILKLRKNLDYFFKSDQIKIKKVKSIEIKISKI